jgi:error-prone DNA polymerase
MPDQPLPKRQPHLSGPVQAPAPAQRYAELHCRTNFSFLEGASYPDELVHRAAELGYIALAITDRNSLAGVVRAHVTAKEMGLKLLIGAEVTPDDAPPVVLLATDRAAYGRLCRLLTTGRRRAPKGECHLTFDDVAQQAAGLLACIPLAPVVEQGPTAAVHRYREVFGDCCYTLAELHLGPDDARLLEKMQQLAQRVKAPLAAANDVHYHRPERRYLQDVLTAIRHGCTVAELGDRMFPNAERSLKAPHEMAALFAACPDAVARTVEIADRCTFSLDDLRYEYPTELSPAGMTPLEYLTRLTWDGARRRYPHGIPDKVHQSLEHELQLIRELKYEAFFLTVWDLVRFARSRDILCQGRGSAANSAVCYCLEVTSVDPDQIDLLFERFLSRERGEAPDIDVDFEHERREEVLQYLYEKYGRERAGIAATVITYRSRSALRDVGKALGLSLDRVDAIAKSMEPRTGSDKFAGRLRGGGLDPASLVGRQLRGLADELLGFPRHLSQHVGGMVLTQGPLCELVPIENAAMADRTVIQWDKDDLEALGLLKVDCLCLGMLTAIRKCFDLIHKHDGRTLTLATVPQDDSPVYEMIQRADTIGVFQIESRAQMSMLPRLKPNCFYDLVIEVAIVRPGPIQGDMVHPYLRRRQNKEPVEYPNEEIKAVLHKTLGVPLFQEQAMKLSQVAAGFTADESDQLRRAMAAWKRKGGLEPFQKKLHEGMLANGYSVEFAERLYRQICGFGEYGFPESHAASFALLVYVSAWLKCLHPAAFCAALLNSQPMGFYAPSQLVLDARQHGVEVRPVDVNASVWDCTLEPRDDDSRHESCWALRLGLRMVRGLSERYARLIVERRANRPFTSFGDFVRRTRLSNAVLKTLSQADVFGSLRLDRRTALWQSLPAQRQLPLFDDVPDDEIPITLPPLTLPEQIVGDYHTAGLSLRGHPLQFLRALLEQRGVVVAADLAHLPADRRYKVAGVVLLRQRPGTAKEITFVTIEDETGPTNLIVRKEVWERYRRVASRASALVAHGRLQRVEGVIHLLVDRLEDLTQSMGNIESRSRDFR